LDMDQFGGGSLERHPANRKTLGPNRHSEPLGDTLV
jgi:hypothetical protein